MRWVGISVYMYEAEARCLGYYGGIELGDGLGVCTLESGLYNIFNTSALVVISFWRDLEYKVALITTSFLVNTRM